MSYLALYRLFRPTTFDGMVRQEHIVKVLRNQIETDKVGHAYLFCGSRGTGKTSTAKIFAKAVNCLQPVNGSPCGKCESCLALAEPSNLDIVEIDAASNNGVAEMRDLREKVQYNPVSCRYKVYIIDEVHMLSDSAFNALLKTLEEPPKHIIFILATTEVHKLPATILSRCMRFDFKLIPQNYLEDFLKKVFKDIGKDYEDEAVSAIARAGEGSVRDTLSVADICVSYSKGKLTYDDVNVVLGSADFFEMSKLCKAILQADSTTSLEITERIIAEGKGVGLLVKDIISFLNNCSIAKMCKNGNSILKLPTEMFEEVVSCANLVDGHRLLRVMQIFTEIDGELRYSISPKIILETAIIKATMPEKDYDVESLLSRIATLEKAVLNGDIKQKPVVKKEKAIITEYDYELAPPDEEECGFGGFEAIAEKENIKNKVKQKLGGESGIKGNVYGEFLKALRNTVKNAVLFTMCADLEHTIDDGVVVIFTDNDTIYRSLNRENHLPLIKTAFESIGVEKFEIRQKENKNSRIDEDIEKLKSQLRGFDIEIK